MPESPHRTWRPLTQFALATALFALAAAATRGNLQEHAHADALAALAGVLPASYYDNDPTTDRLHIHDVDALGSTEPMPVWRARRNGQASALVVDAIASGYGGPLRLRIGIARDGTLIGVRVVAHRETRGLGDAFAYDGGRWLAQLSGRTLNDPPESGWTVRRDGGVFDQFSHATVTPRAILARVRAVLAAYEVQHERWFASGETRR